MELFGFNIKRDPALENQEEKRPSFTDRLDSDGALEISGVTGSSYGTFVDLEGTARNETSLINKYRSMEQFPECDRAIDDIVNEAIILDENKKAVDINLDDLTDASKSVKTAITEEFDQILRLLDFNNKGYDIFRRWYVDGRIYYHKVVDQDKPRDGIKELRQVDSRKINKIRRPNRKKDPRTGVTVYLKPEIFYIFSPKGMSTNNDAVKIAEDSIAHITSGVIDFRTNMALSYLHKAIKPLNQLRMLEDATVIYTMSRAPERRIFYIDVGNLPKIKAEQYLNQMMTKHKNKLVYDASNGSVRDDRKYMTMLEDFWLPRREGGRGTEISTLPGGQNLGEMEHVEYFKRKTLESMNVPISRLESEGTFNMGRGSEITRDEVRFAKFISRLRTKFNDLFDDLLCTQLILKNVINSKAEWEMMKEYINYDYHQDNYFSELKESEIFQSRLNLANDADPFVGKYFSADWVRRNILRQSEEDIKEIDKQIKSEMEDQEDQFGVGGPGEPGGVAPHMHDPDNMNGMDELGQQQPPQQDDGGEIVGPPASQVQRKQQSRLQ